MAIVRPQAAGGNRSLKIALIAFVALTVVSLAGTIVVLTNYSDMQTRMNEAADRAGRADRDLRNMQQQLERFSQIVAGAEPTSEIPKIQRAIDAGRRKVVDDPALKDANLTPDTAVMTVLQTLHAHFTTQGEQLRKITQERDELRAEREQMLRTAEATRQAFTDETEKLQQRYQELEQQSAKDREAWRQQVAALRTQLEKAGEAASQQLAAERQQRQAVTKERDDAQARAKELVATLASFRPSPDLTSALQIADAQILRAVAGENIVYISLGERDGLKRGMTFAVYSRIGGIPPDGRGKATIEVTDVFETTAECKVTSTTPSEPIVEGDVAANPVFDKARKLNFVVGGDFDLNFDGQIDDPGGVQVAALISQAGGNVVKTLDTRTDFVVLGAPPPLAAEPQAQETPEARERAARRAAERKTFDAIVTDAKSLAIPVLSRTQFLHFLGISVPLDAPEDRLPG